MSEPLPAYAELHCLSNFSFLRGASHAEELVQRAHALGYAALAMTDECSLAGVVRAHVAAKAVGLKLLIGSEVTLDDGMKLVFLAKNRAGYGNLSAVISLARRQADKGRYQLKRMDLANGIPDCIVLWLASKEASGDDARWLSSRFPENVWIAYERLLSPFDTAHLTQLRRLSVQTGLPLVASGDVHMHVRSRRPLQDTLTALRLNLTLDETGYALFPNGERYLRPRVRLSQLYPADLLAETVHVAEQCQFSLDELRYEYPEEVVPHGLSPAEYLRQEVMAGLAVRYPHNIPEKVRSQVKHELSLIAEMQYEAYFLTVYDIVKFARSQQILCQGRGSAANSAVCYALGITEVDPAQSSLLFERFISQERNEPPDIDVDFEHERREEVIQYIYRKYGRERAALAAAVISYRTRSALRDAGRVLGIESERINALTASLAWWDQREELGARFREVGLDPDSPVVEKWLYLAEALRGFPRHLSQHVGGFVMSRGRLDRLVPIENAAMPERTIIQWDKDDIDALGLMKVDVLALGMLSAIRRTLGEISKREGRSVCMQDLPREDPLTYAMIQRADTIGVFQIESRAQMAMLPRLRPQSFYDLVIEVAIVRPGPIQGDMVHPYLRRRQGLEPVSYPSEAVQGVLERTLGVPIFQEQVMQLAIVAAGFTPGEADQLRRSMAAWKRKGGVTHLRDRLIDGMLARGYPTSFAAAIYRQIEGFGEYGFPESHAASFALLVYISAWLKCHEPAAFLVGLINAQPMGFYSSSQLVQDAQRHGVEVLPPDVQVSAFHSELAGPRLAHVRLGLHLIKGLPKALGVKIASMAPYRDLPDLIRKTGVSRADLSILADGGALVSIAGHRRDALWAVSDVPIQQDLLLQACVDDENANFIPLSEAENLLADYASLHLSLGRHPLAHLREVLTQKRYVPSMTLHEYPDRRLARCAGLVTCRQRPGGGKVVFLTLEDEGGLVNVIVHSTLATRQRRELLSAKLLGVLGVVQREGEVLHLVAKRLVDHSEMIGALYTASRDFH